MLEVLKFWFTKDLVHTPHQTYGFLSVMLIHDAEIYQGKAMQAI